MELPIGSTVADGKYRIERVLGVGGMGCVYAATHTELQTTVALKVILPEIFHDPVAGARFIREAKATARLRGEHNVRIYDVGTLKNGVPFIVMEYMTGRRLLDVLSEQGMFTVEVAADYVRQACEALAEAHALGIVHRDLKPANLFITFRPNGTACLKVIDYGIAKDNADGMELTDVLAFLGTPAYMSPEQLASAKYVDARSDIWSLGAILYESLTGMRPFGGAKLKDQMHAIREEEPKPLAELRADAPPELVAVVARCLAKAPDDRFEDVDVLADALAAIIAKERSRAEQTTARGPSTEGEAPRPKRRQGLISIGAALVAIAGIGVGVRSQSASADDARTAPPKAEQAAPSAVSATTPPEAASVVQPAPTLAVPEPSTKSPPAPRVALSARPNRPAPIAPAAPSDERSDRRTFSDRKW